MYDGPIPPISPHIVRELTNGPGIYDRESGSYMDGQHRFGVNVEPYSQDK